MILKGITAKGFRNLNGESGELCFEPCPGINILSGANAQGKTNLIEAVYFCATSRSHRTSSYRDLICAGEEAAYLRATVASGGLNPYHNRIDASLKRTGGGRSVAVNGLAIDKLGDLLGLLYCVIFSPEDLNLIKDGPAERRRFMDMELCQVSKVYYYELKQYYRILKQRNSLLKTLQKKPDKTLWETIEPWDGQLCLSHAKISDMRGAYIKKIDAAAAEIHAKIGNEKLSVLYRPSVPPGDLPARLKKSLDSDVRNGATGFGAHKDDVAFFINGMDSRMYGSQGQQRTAALSLKLAEVETIRRDKGENPLLLLDDVMSELDAVRQECLLNALGGIQTVITCTGVEDILSGALKKSYNTFHFLAENGRIRKA